MGRSSIFKTTVLALALAGMGLSGAHAADCKRAEPMHILAVGAHPDDIEFNVGGTLLRYRKMGC